MVPQAGQVSDFAFNAPVFGRSDIVGGLRGTTDYGLFFTISDIPQNANLVASRLEFWGVPADPAHDAARGGASDAPPKPFLTLPTACAGPQTTTLTVPSYNDETATKTATTATGASGCDTLPFSPKLSAVADGKTSASNGAGLTVTLEQPEDQANVHSVSVVLPKELTARGSTVVGACLEQTFQADPAGCAAAAGRDRLVLDAAAGRHARRPGLPRGASRRRPADARGGAHRAGPPDPADRDDHLRARGPHVDVRQRARPADHAVRAHPPDRAALRALRQQGSLRRAADDGDDDHRPERRADRQDHADRRDRLRGVEADRGLKLRILRARVRGSLVALTVKVPRAGRLTATGKGLRRTSVKVTRARTLKMKVKLSKAAAKRRARLHRHHKHLKVRVRLRLGTLVASRLVTFR